jgi:hypothetical protein
MTEHLYCSREPTDGRISYIYMIENTQFYPQTVKFPIVIYQTFASM